MIKKKRYQKPVAVAVNFEMESMMLTASIEGGGTTSGGTAQSNELYHGFDWDESEPENYDEDPYAWE